jgi:hypothetical protein
MAALKIAGTEILIGGRACMGAIAVRETSSEYASNLNPDLVRRLSRGSPNRCGGIGVSATRPAQRGRLTKLSHRIPPIYLDRILPVGQHSCRWTLTDKRSD